MISRSFAEKGDLTTLANVTYDVIAEQVKISGFSVKFAKVKINIFNCFHEFFLGPSSLGQSLQGWFEHRH